MDEQSRQFEREAEGDASAAAAGLAAALRDAGEDPAALEAAYRAFVAPLIDRLKPLDLVGMIAEAAGLRTKHRLVRLVDSVGEREVDGRHGLTLAFYERQAWPLWSVSAWRGLEHVGWQNVTPRQAMRVIAVPHSCWGLFAGDPREWREAFARELVSLGARDPRWTRRVATDPVDSVLLDVDGLDYFFGWSYQEGSGDLDDESDQVECFVHPAWWSQEDGLGAMRSPERNFSFVATPGDAFAMAEAHVEAVRCRSPGRPDEFMRLAFRLLPSKAGMGIPDFFRRKSELRWTTRVACTSSTFGAPVVPGVFLRRDEAGVSAAVHYRLESGWQRGSRWFQAPAELAHELGRLWPEYGCSATPS